MATYKGSLGKVFAGPTPTQVAEVKTWSLSESADEVDTSIIGTGNKRIEAGAIKASGQLSCWWDPADAGFNLLVIGQSVDIDLYPSGDTSGATYYSLTATILNIERNGGADGRVEASVSFGGNGGVTTNVVP